MNRIAIAVLGVVAVTASGAAVARGLGEAGDLEHARAMARAGGRVSEYDAELLQRYGCTSGTYSPYCHHYGYRTRWHHRHYRGYR